jgi:hemerythrin-like domain-containing protein
MASSVKKASASAAKRQPASAAKGSQSRSAVSAKRAVPDAISLLKQDHVKVKQLLTRLDNTTERAAERRKQLLKEIEHELKMHTRIEEEIFYPAFEKAVTAADGHMYYEALEEHHLVDIVLLEMKGKSVESDEFSAKAKVLKDLIEHHAIEEEEGEMFPIARKKIGAARLRELGTEMQARKKQLQSNVLTRVAMTAGSAVGKVMSKVGRHKDAA